MAGVSPKFSAIDVLRALLILSEDPLSRQEAVRLLGIGEGSVRSVFDELKENDLTDSTRQGHFLSNGGVLIKKKILNRISLPAPIKFSPFSRYFGLAVIVYKPDSFADPILLRDQALKWGADAAMILSMTKGVLLMPKCDPSTDLSEFKSQLKIPEGGIAILSFADSILASQTSALAASISADSELRDIVQKNFVKKKSPLPIPL